MGAWLLWTSYLNVLRVEKQHFLNISSSQGLLEGLPGYEEKIDYRKAVCSEGCILNTKGACGCVQSHTPAAKPGMLYNPCPSLIYQEQLGHHWSFGSFGLFSLKSSCVKFPVFWICFLVGKEIVRRMDWPGTGNCINGFTGTAWCQTWTSEVYVSCFFQECLWAVLDCNYETQGVLHSLRPLHDNLTQTIMSGDSESTPWIHYKL